VAAQNGRARHGEINEIAAFPSPRQGFSRQGFSRKGGSGQISFEVGRGEAGAEGAKD
jgi:hypothetical protein